MRQKSFVVRGVGVCLFLILLSAAAFAQTGNNTEGSLRVMNADGNSLGLCPLKNTAVKAEISGFISRVTVTQTFQNPFADKIEAVYTFPLPNDAAVDEMTINIGDRLVKGKIMERKKAQETYDQAKKEGKVAAILEQQRPNIFTQSVANITPGAEIKVVISYVETLKYSDDTYEFMFPMTIGERYLPAAGAEDAAKISPKSKQRPGHTISMEIKLDAGVSIETVASNTHLIEAQQFSASQFVVKLRDENEIPNRDFVLKYKTAGVKIEDAILTHKNANGGFFTMILQPPDKVFPADTMPKEIVFVMDTSGSMDGFPIKKAKEAMNLTLDNLNPNDTFNLITFAGDTRILFDNPIAATKENLEKAKKWLSNTDSGGGTEMMTAIRAALAPSDSQSHVRVVCFMTDGQVGNEAEIIAEVQKHPNARVFAFGIGDSVNHYLLDEISREGRGDVEYVGLKDNGSAAARRFYERIKNPLLTDISFEFEGIETEEVFPKLIPDLFDAKPVSIVGRYSKGGNGKVILHGKMQGQAFQREIAVSFPEQNAENDVLATIWARRKIADLTRRDYTGLAKNQMAEELQTTMTNLGLEFKIITPFTSFVAVDDQIVTDGTNAPKRVEVPVAQPTNGSDTLPNGTDFSTILKTAPSVRPEPLSAGFQIDGSSGISETVEITANADVSSTNSSLSTNVSQQAIVSLPVNGRSFQALFSTAGGATQTAERRSQIEQGLISSNGQRPTSNVFTVEGFSANTSVSADETSLSGNLGALPSLTASGGTNSLSTIGATQETTVKTMASAKEQRTSGATVNFVTKGGNNTFHGSVFETFGNENLNANDFFANSKGFNRPPSRLNQFGATLGGFIWKDKAWFFGGYEGLRLRQAAFAVTEVPNFSSRQTAAPEVRAILNAFPVANGETTANGLAEFAANYTNPAAHDIFGIRIDLQPTNKFRIGAHYNFADSTASLRGDRDFSLNTLRKFDVQTNSFSAWTSFTPSSTVVLDGRVNFTRNNPTQRFSTDNFGGADVSTSLFAAPFDFLKYDFNGKNSAIATGSKNETTVNQFQANGAVVWIWNNHNFSFGADFRRLSADIGAAQRERSILFSGVNLSGTASRINEISRISPPDATINNFSLFAQDDWRISPRLILNAGLRWDTDFAPKVGSGNLSFQNASPQMRNQTKNFAPRASVAWDVFGNGKAIIRGGGGLYFDYSNAAASEVFANSFPFAGGNFARNLSFTATPTNSLKPLIVFADDLKTPHTWHVFGEYQQEFFRNHIFTATYTASFGRKLFLTRTFLNADPQFNYVRLTNNDAKSDFNSLQLRFERRFSQGFSFNVRYTLAKSTDNISPDAWRENNFVSNDVTNERGASDFDVRHQMNVYAVYDIPIFFDSGWKKSLTKGWSILAFANARSAFPLSAGYFRINDFGKDFVRADLSGNAPVYLTENGVKRLNPNAFSIPGANRQGTLGRNSLRGFALFQLDTSLQRRIRFTNEMRLEISINAYNLLNNTNFAEMSGNLGTIGSNGIFQPNNYFGKTNSTFGSGNFTPFYLYGGARTVQLSAKFVF
ncbi:MAG: TonB-dependent receptor [Actinomycetota bacterium]